MHNLMFHWQIDLWQVSKVVLNFILCESLVHHWKDFPQSLLLNFSKEVIKQKDNIIDGIGWPDWQLTIFLLLAWLAVYIVIAKGVKSSGKFSYFLAIFPYVVMIILLIRAVTLDGAIDGIKFFIYPDFKKLIEPKVN